MTPSASMASSPTAASVFILLLCAFTTSASAATFTITNNCSFTLWPAAVPVGGGLQLNPGKTWTLDVPIGTNAGSIWGRTGCSFNSSGSGDCATGDCAGALSCRTPGQPPRTVAEFTIGSAADYYDISVINGYNLPMDFSCSSGVTLRCRDPSCPDAYHFPEGPKLSACRGNSSYLVTFCP